MRFDTPIDDAFRTRSYVRILRSLDELPEGLPASAREIARRAGLSHPAASRVLASLSDQGLVLARRAPRADAFEINRGHVLVEQLVELFRWERRLSNELMSFLRREIGQQAPRVSEAFLFGSLARGEAGPTSDLDVAVLCPSDAIDPVTDGMERVGDAVRRRFGSPLSVVLGTEPLEELQDRRHPGYRLWLGIAREGLRLLPVSEEDPIRA